MIVSISPHMITQKAKKVKGFFKKCLKNIKGKIKRCWKDEKSKTRKKKFSIKVTTNNNFAVEGDFCGVSLQ